MKVDATLTLEDFRSALAAYVIGLTGYEPADIFVVNRSGRVFLISSPDKSVSYRDASDAVICREVPSA